MTTPLILTNQALKISGVLGVGQTALPEDTNDAFLQMNMMMSQWQRKRWLVYCLETTSKVATGAVSYTVGLGGDFNIPRPDRIESAYFRQLVTSQPNQIDYPLTIIQARENYNQIALKELSSWPQYLFYESSFPLGRIYVWPVPQASVYSIFISVKTALSRFTSLAQTIDLPPEYEAALQWNLAMRLRPLYQLPADETITMMARDSLNVIRGANTQIATLQMPTRLVRNALYNIHSDQSY